MTARPRQITLTEWLAAREGGRIRDIWGFCARRGCAVSYSVPNISRWIGNTVFSKCVRYRGNSITIRLQLRA